MFLAFLGCAVCASRRTIQKARPLAFVLTTDLCLSFERCRFAFLECQRLPLSMSVAIQEWASFPHVRVHEPGWRPILMKAGLLQQCTLGALLKLPACPFISERMA